ncbi:MAG: RHS repeat-associated core domain-containing protein [Saprospiraceae bacterium]|nr:RHS repeat-associated core domain-containing protein [Saprospiraceae bacterium]
MNFRANGTAVTFLEEMHYYPFGMLMEGIGTAAVTVNKYKYNGKELNDDLGLNWSDYGARWYDPAVCRWWSVDPLAEMALNWTPYRYGFNNPVLFFDQFGAFETKKEAKEYAKEHGIKTGWFSNNKIVKQSDGSYSIDNKNEGSSTYNDATFGGVVTAALVTATKLEPSESSTSNGSSGSNGWLTNATVATQNNPSRTGPPTHMYDFADKAPIVLTGTIAALFGVGLVIECGVGMSLGTSSTYSIPALRAAYEAEVRALSSIVNQMRASGKTAEEIAKVVHKLRREIGVKYKNMSPADKLKEFYQRNLEKYGDRLGPTLEYLRAQGKSWEQIIESAMRPGGKDLGF